MASEHELPDFYFEVYYVHLAENPGRTAQFQRFIDDINTSPYQRHVPDTAWEKWQKDWENLLVYFEPHVGKTMQVAAAPVDELDRKAVLLKQAHELLITMALHEEIFIPRHNTLIKSSDYSADLFLADDCSEGEIVENSFFAAHKALQRHIFQLSPAPKDAPHYLFALGLRGTDVLPSLFTSRDISRAMIPVTHFLNIGANENWVIDAEHAVFTSSLNQLAQSTLQPPDLTP
jgi:hypothetical protein